MHPKYDISVTEWCIVWSWVLTGAVNIWFAVLSSRYLVIHAVDTIWPQQLDGLADQVGAAAVQHAETQVQLELICGGFGIQPPEGAKAALGPTEDRRRVRKQAWTKRRTVKEWVGKGVVVFSSCFHGWSAVFSWSVFKSLSIRLGSWGSVKIWGFAEGLCQCFNAVWWKVTY